MVQIKKWKNKAEKSHGSNRRSHVGPSPAVTASLRRHIADHLVFRGIPLAFFFPFQIYDFDGKLV